MSILTYEITSFHVDVFENLVFAVFIAGAITCEGYQCQKSDHSEKDVHFHPKITGFKQEKHIHKRSEVCIRFYF